MSGDPKLTDDTNEGNGLVRYRLQIVEREQEELRKIVDPLRVEMARNTAATEANTKAINDERDERKEDRQAMKELNERIIRILIAVAVISAALAAAGSKVIPFP